MGGALVRFQDTFYDTARSAIITRPEVHGFGGVEVIDQQRIAIVNLPLPERLKRSLCVLVSLGALYPPGWLLLGVLIPYWGVNALRAPIEFGLFAPFGGAAIVGIWGTLSTTLHEQIVEGLSRRQAEPVKQAFRHVFFYLLSELAEAMWTHLENPEAVAAVPVLLPLFQRQPGSVPGPQPPGRLSGAAHHHRSA
jgi:hypothetical protein